MKTISIIIVLLLLGACATPVEYATNQCRKAGYAESSPYWSQCVNQNYQQRMAYAAVLQNIRYYPPVTPIVTQCRNLGNGVTCTTQ